MLREGAHRYSKSFRLKLICRKLIPADSVINTGLQFVFNCPNDAN